MVVILEREVRVTLSSVCGELLHREDFEDFLVGKMTCALPPFGSEMVRTSTSPLCSTDVEGDRCDPLAFEYGTMESATSALLPQQQCNLNIKNL
jgi:hypothetical protein